MIRKPRYIIFLIPTLILIIFYGSQSLAGGREDAAKALKEMTRPQFQKAVLDAAKKATVVRENACSSSKFTPSNKFAIVSPFKYDARGIVSKGAWRQAVTWKGCGQERILNIYVEVNAEKNFIKVTDFIPGNSRADLLLQRDALLSAVPILQEYTGIKNCKGWYVDDTKFLRETGGPLKKGGSHSWDELWTVNFCAKKVQLLMQFIPDATGTIFNVQIKKSK